jgi:iron(III) transport system substrate-binding protein
MARLCRILLSRFKETDSGHGHIISELKTATKFFANLSIIVALLVCPTRSLSAPPGFGSSLEEVVKLASKEGNVRIAASLEPEDVRTVLEGFYKKYPQIKVEYVRITGVDQSEKILTEALAGSVGYDTVKLVAEQQGQFVKSGVLAGPFEWQKYFPDIPKLNLSPDGLMAGGSLYPEVIAYNPTLVPRERVPRKWEDCFDPYWKGRFVMDVRPFILIGLYPQWGEEKVLDYAKKIKDNSPIWKRGTESLNQVAIGEIPMVCGTYYAAVFRMLRQDPRAHIRAAWPKEVPVLLNEVLGVMKGAKNPNAALLLAGWLASPEGQRGYDLVARGSPFLKGTKTWDIFQTSKSQPIFVGWDEARIAPLVTKKVSSVWGIR